MAGSSTYPTSVDNKTALQDGIDYMEADNVNNAYVPMTATQTFLGANGKGSSWSSDVLDYLANAKAPIITKASASTLSVSAGAVFIKNSGQANRLMRRNTIATTVSISNLDTGSTVSVAYYYVYAVADTAATTFTIVISTSASSPTGLTNFELIGWFYNETGGSALDITSGFVGNMKTNGRDVPNWVYLSSTGDITLNDTSYGTDLDAILIRIYTSGRPVELVANIALSSAGANPNLTQFIVNLDTSDVAATETNARNTAGGDDFSSPTLLYAGTPAAGTHTFKIRGKVAANSITVTSWGISVKEL